MAKIPPDAYALPARGTALRGLAYTQVRNGRMVWVRWPRKRPTAGSPENQTRRDNIALAARVSIYMDVHQQMFARKVSERGPLQPRDLLMAALFRRIGTVVTREGRKIYSMAAMQDVSDLLDSIGQVEGTILYRGPTWWMALAPGVPDQVLTVDADGSPAWMPSQGGGGGGRQGYANTWGTTSGSAGASKGAFITPMLDTTVHSIMGRVAMANGGQYRWGIYEVDGSRAITQILAQTSIVTSLANQSTNLYQDLPAPVVLNAGQEYALLMSRSDGTDTTNAGLYQGNGNPIGLPTLGDNSYAIYSHKAPAIGDTPSSTGTNCFSHGLVVEVDW